MTAPAVSILLPTDPDVAVTLRALQALARLGDEPAFEVIVVVPAGDAPTRALLAGLEGDVRVIVAEADEPPAPGDAFDRAATEAQGDVLVALTASAQPADGWLGVLMAALQDGATAALPRSLTANAIDLPEASWLALAVRADAYRTLGGFAATRALGQAEKLTLLDALRAAGHAVAAAPAAVLIAA